MTGYESKRAAAQDKLAQPEQEALKLALEALKEIARHATTPWEDEWCGELANETLKAINALAQPAQEPVCPTCKAGVLYECVACSSNNYPQKPAQEPVGKFAKFTDGVWREVTNGSAGISLYTHPPQRKPLTDVMIKEWAERHDINGLMTDLRCMAEDAETLYLLAEEKNNEAV